jgi:hypothetical protein
MLVSTSAASPGLIMHGDFSCDHRKKIFIFLAPPFDALSASKLAKIVGKNQKRFKNCMKTIRKISKEGLKMN